MNYEQFREPTLTEAKREEDPHYEAKELSGGCSKRSCHNPSFPYLSLFSFFSLHSFGTWQNQSNIIPLLVKTIDCQFIESTRLDSIDRNLSISPLSQCCQGLSRGIKLGHAFPREEWLFGFNERG